MTRSIARAVAALVTVALPSLLFVGSVGAQLPPPDGQITSDFGPRNVSTSPFHAGVDYSVALGDGDVGYPIRSLEAGHIVAVDYDRGGRGGYYVAV